MDPFATALTRRSESVTPSAYEHETRHFKHDIQLNLLACLQEIHQVAILLPTPSCEQANTNRIHFTH